MNIKSAFIFFISLIILISNILLSGDIKGKVIFKTFPTKIKAFNPYRFKIPIKNEQIESPAENIVIYIDDPALNKNSLRLSEKIHTIIQKNQTFIPHVLPVLVSTKVDFPNLDPFYHNVFSLSRAKKFDLGRYPTSKSKKVEFNKPGIVKVFCEIHSDMSAIIIVLENPFFTKPDKDGKYFINDVPSGAYNLVAWHENFTPIIKKVNVPRKGSITVNYVFE